MKNLIKRHYQAIVNRGLITKETELIDFLIKIGEEKDELIKEMAKYSSERENNMAQESIDLVMVVLNMLQHFDIDIKKEIIKNIELQEKRANEKSKQLK